MERELWYIVATHLTHLATLERPGRCTHPAKRRRHIAPAASSTVTSHNAGPSPGGPKQETMSIGDQVQVEVILNWFSEVNLDPSRRRH